MTAQYQTIIQTILTTINSITLGWNTDTLTYYDIIRLILQDENGVMVQNTTIDGTNPVPYYTFDGLTPGVGYDVKMEGVTKDGIVDDLSPNTTTKHSRKLRIGFGLTLFWILERT